MAMLGCWTIAVIVLTTVVLAKPPWFWQFADPWTGTAVVPAELPWVEIAEPEAGDRAGVRVVELIFIALASKLVGAAAPATPELLRLAWRFIHRGVCGCPCSDPGITTGLFRQVAVVDMPMVVSCRVVSDLHRTCRPVRRTPLRHSSIDAWLGFVTFRHRGVQRLPGADRLAAGLVLSGKSAVVGLARHRRPGSFRVGREHRLARRSGAKSGCCWPARDSRWPGGFS